jgi:hypothetical protein
MPRDCHAIDGIDPITRKTRHLYIRDRMIGNTGRKSKGHALELGRTVPHCLQHPCAVFRGMTDWDGEDGDETWLIYACIPVCAYNYATGEAMPPWKDEIFLVFVDDDWIVRRYKWVKVDENDPKKLPDGHDSGRFHERLL